MSAQSSVRHRFSHLWCASLAVFSFRPCRRRRRRRSRNHFHTFICIPSVVVNTSANKQSSSSGRHPESVSQRAHTGIQVDKRQRAVDTNKTDSRSRSQLHCIARVCATELRVSSSKDDQSSPSSRRGQQKKNRASRVHPETTANPSTENAVTNRLHTSVRPSSRHRTVIAHRRHCSVPTACMHVCPCVCCVRMCVCGRVQPSGTSASAVAASVWDGEHAPAQTWLLCLIFS